MVIHHASFGAHDELTDDHLRLMTDAHERAGQ